MTEDVHDEALRRFEEATAALQANIRRMIDQTPPGHPVIGCLEWADGELDRTPYFYQPPKRIVIPSGCYEASWGWVHVKPGCRCPR